MSAVYVSSQVRDRLAAAQATIEGHLTACPSCAIVGPCQERVEAERLFLRYGRLPRRTPGMTSGPGRAEVAFTWFGSR
jgi:hypothetical protein